MVLRFLVVLFLFSSCQSDSKTGSVDLEEEQEDVALSGDKLYLNHCSNCHGLDGKLGNSGAKDLSVSRFSDAEIVQIIQEGKNAMPPLAELMESKQEMDSVVEYVKRLRK